MSLISERLEAVARRASEEIQTIADEYRERKIVPLCRRRGWEFMAGNGTWVFYDKRGQRVDEDRIPGDIVFDLDSPTLGRDDLFGFYISDVRKESAS